MLFTIGDRIYNTRNIMYMNAAYKIMGAYVIEIYFRNVEKPVVLSYNSKSKFDSALEYIESVIDTVE